MTPFSLQNEVSMQGGGALPCSLGAVHHSDSAIVADPGQAVPRGREGDRMDPTPSAWHTQVHKQHGILLQRATGQECLNEHTLVKGYTPAPPNSASTAPNGILLPQGVGPGFSSTSFM